MPYYSEAHICQCLTGLATVHGQCAVTISGCRQKNGIEFVQGVIARSRWLIQLGIKPGDVVSISALNCDLYLEWILAITYVGGIAAPLNYRWSLEEAKSAMEIAQPVLLVTDSSHGYWHSTFTIDPKSSLHWHVLMDTPVQANETRIFYETGIFDTHSVSNAQEDYRWAPERVAIICFTSGTTGTPKGVAISHSALVMQSLAKVAMVGYNENDIYLHTVPLCHIGGISSALAMLMVGGFHVFIPKFDPKSAGGAIQDHKVSTLITVPTIMVDLITFYRTKNYCSTFESVRKVLNGGGSLSREIIKDATKLFPRATLLSAYGMTEACSSLTFMTLYDTTKAQCSYKEGSDELDGRGVCVGKPAPHVELKVRAMESERTGRIVMRGPHAMLGYWSAQSSSKILESGNEGWIETGDVGHFDDKGNLWLVGRARGRIKSGGENIYPEEVEAVLSRHPGISSNVVVGLPDPRLIETVVACLRLKDGWLWTDYTSNVSHSSKEHLVQYLSSDILTHFCREKHLTGFKIPKRFILWATPFPMTTTGKIKRDQIKAQVMSDSYFNNYTSRL